MGRDARMKKLRRQRAFSIPTFDFLPNTFACRLLRTAVWGAPFRPVCVKARTWKWKPADKTKAKTLLEQFVGKHTLDKSSSKSTSAPTPLSSIRDAAIAKRRKTSSSTETEVDEYLNSGPVHDVSILSYWKGAKFAGLREVARDYLGSPVSSVQSERENSKARNVITDIRNRLSSKSVQAQMCLKSWNMVLKPSITEID